MIYFSISDTAAQKQFRRKMKVIENLKQFGILVIRTIWLRGAAFLSFLDVTHAEKMGRTGVRQGGYVTAKNTTTGE